MARHLKSKSDPTKSVVRQNNNSYSDMFKPGPEVKAPALDKVAFFSDQQPKEPKPTQAAQAPATLSERSTVHASGTPKHNVYRTLAERTPYMAAGATPDKKYGMEGREKDVAQLAKSLPESPKATPAATSKSTHVASHKPKAHHLSAAKPNEALADFDKTAPASLASTDKSSASQGLVGGLTTGATPAATPVHASAADAKQVEDFMNKAVASSDARVAASGMFSALATGLAEKSAASLTPQASGPTASELAGLDPSVREGVSSSVALVAPAAATQPTEQGKDLGGGAAQADKLHSATNMQSAAGSESAMTSFSALLDSATGSVKEFVDSVYARFGSPEGASTSTAPGASGGVVGALKEKVGEAYAEGAKTIESAQNTIGNALANGGASVKEFLESVNAQFGSPAGAQPVHASVANAKEVDSFFQNVDSKASGATVAQAGAEGPAVDGAKATGNSLIDSLRAQNLISPEFADKLALALAPASSEAQTSNAVSHEASTTSALENTQAQESSQRSEPTPDVQAAQTENAKDASQGKSGQNMESAQNQESRSQSKEGPEMEMDMGGM